MELHSHSRSSFQSAPEAATVAAQEPGGVSLPGSSCWGSIPHASIMAKNCPCGARFSGTAGRCPACVGVVYASPTTKAVLPEPSKNAPPRKRGPELAKEGGKFLPQALYSASTAEAADAIRGLLFTKSVRVIGERQILAEFRHCRGEGEGAFAVACVIRVGLQTLRGYDYEFAGDAGSVRLARKYHLAEMVHKALAGATERAGVRVQAGLPAPVERGEAYEPPPVRSRGPKHRPKRKWRLRARQAPVLAPVGRVAVKEARKWGAVMRHPRNIPLTSKRVRSNVDTISLLGKTGREWYKKRQEELSPAAPVALCASHRVRCTVSRRVAPGISPRTRFVAVRGEAVAQSGLCS